MSTLGSWNAELNNFSDVAAIFNSPTIVTSPVIFGARCYRIQLLNPAPEIRFIGGINKSTAYFRVYVQIDITTNPSSNVDEGGFIYFGDSGATSGMAIKISVDTGGGLALNATNNNGGAIIGGFFSLNDGQTYLIEGKCVIHASAGIIEWKVDGVQIALGTGLNTGSTNIDRLAIFAATSIPANGGAGSEYLDEIAVSDSDWLGPFVPSGNFPFITTIGAKRI